MSSKSGNDSAATMMITPVNHWFSAASKLISYQVEMTAFAMRRVSRHKGTADALSQCRSPEDVISTLTAFSRDTVNDYTDCITNFDFLAMSPAERNGDESEFERVQALAKSMSGGKKTSRTRRRAKTQTGTD